MRVSWNNVSVIDPFLTIPVIVFVIIAVLRKNKLMPFLGIIYIFIYLGFGLVQSNRAEEVGKKIASIRGHESMRLTVKPSLGNLFLWKSIYEDRGFYYVDAVRLFSTKQYCEGTKIKKLDNLIDFNDLDKKSQQYLDIDRFNWFSQGYLGIGKSKNIITDVRYSAVPNEVDGLWGIKIDSSKKSLEHVEWVVNRSDYGKKWKPLNMALNTDERRPSSELFTSIPVQRMPFTMTQTSSRSVIRTSTTRGSKLWGRFYLMATSLRWLTPLKIQLIQR